MSQSLDELLERMEREKQPAMTVEQLRQLTQEEHTRDSAMTQQMSNQIANQKKLTAKSFFEQAGAKYSVPKKSHREYFVELDGHSDHTVEADEIEVRGNFLIFSLEGKIQLITTERQVVSVVESEE